MKEVHCRLQDLPILHPRLLWETIILAAASVMEVADRRAPHTFLILAEDIPGFGSDELALTIDPSGYDEESIVRLRRTFELARQVELAAIAVAALALAHSGGHEIVDVALRGSAADYLVGDTPSRLERRGIGFPSRAINPHSFSWLSSRASRGDWDMLEVSLLASL